MASMTSLHRLLSIGCAVALLLVLGAATAHAHGGNFRAPEGGFPGVPPPSVPGDSAPPSGPPTPPSLPMPTGRGRIPATTNWTPADWQVWWQLNLEAHLPPWGEFEKALGTTTSSESVFHVGRATVGDDPTRTDERRERGATIFALPYLMSLIDRSHDVDEPMIAAALIAVARIAREHPPIDIFRTWAVDRRASLEVRESAVLALGLVRRTERWRQLPVEDLADIRDFLVVLFDDDKAPTRTRAFAAFSLALLADQPFPDTSIERDGRLLTRALWQRIRTKYPSPDLTIALFAALGHQPSRGVPTGILDSLRRIARGQPVFRRTWDTMERSHALMALARLGGRNCTETLLNTLRSTRTPDAVQAAALIGLALRADRMDPALRADTAHTLRRLLNADRHWQVRGLGHITLGVLLGADMRRGSTEVLEHTDVLRFLDAEARKGSTITRPFSALAIGLAAYDVQPAARVIAVALERIRETTKWGLRYGRGADPVVGAYAVAAGLSKAECARPTLLEILKDTNRDFALRGHCALALGQLGRPTEEVVSVLLDAMRERIAPFVQTQAVRALALLDTSGVREELIKQLAGRRTSRPALAVVAGSLGRLHDPEAVSRLLDLARDERASNYVRVSAVVALGLTFDPEPRPSRVLLTTNANYPSLTWSLAQVFNIM